MELLIRLARGTDGSYRAWCPALPGCAVSADSRAEARIKIANAVRSYLTRLDAVLPKELARACMAGSVRGVA
ncbi:MAG: type II toxin-antitoxin system HicB family antitoxin [Planctomycetota bacterium]